METSNLRVFSFAELKAATENFRPGMFGKGGFGRMFKGWVTWVDENTLVPSTIIGTGIAVAVKRFYPGSSEDVEQWEVVLLFQLVEHIYLTYEEKEPFNYERSSHAFPLVSLFYDVMPHVPLSICELSFFKILM